MSSQSFPYSHTIATNKVVDDNVPLIIAPSSAEREAIAKAYDLLEITKLKADFTLKPYRKSGVRVIGEIHVTMTQTCVVTLEPFESTLVCKVNRTFEPKSSKPRKARDLNDDGEIELELEGIDPPDVILDGILDLGATVCEELALSLDTFPRKPGAELDIELGSEMDSKETEEAKPSPFEALKALKDSSKA